MKTTVSKTAVFSICLICLIPVFGLCQSAIEGKWEGKFMNNFKTILQITAERNNHFTGNIKMFSGEQLIQDDPISKITCNQNILTFFIDAKETDFKGEINQQNNELKGVFIFPDQSEHPIILIKNNSESSFENDKSKSFQKLKNHKYSAKELQQDYGFMIDKIKELHPQLYSYISKEDFDKLLKETEAQINNELKLSEFFVLISPVIESIKCSHTGIRLPSDYESLNRQFGNFLPIKTFFDGRQLYCVEYLNDQIQMVKPGNEITSINKLSIKEITEKIFPLIPVEGNNHSTKNYLFNQNFNTYFNLVDDSPKFEIEYNSGNNNFHVQIESCPLSALVEQSVLQTNKPLDFFIDKKIKTGVLTIRAFMFPDVNLYIQQMDSIFKTLKNENIPQLVIDLRGNQGGHPIFAAQLLSYITKDEFIYFKKNDLVKDFEPLYHKMQPNILQYTGKIYAFVNGGCLSTTGHFISLLKTNTDTYFVGEEPGSLNRCNDFSKKEILPNTGIELNIPQTVFETTASGYLEKYPFEVDYSITLTIEDRLSGKDKYLEFFKNTVLKP